LVCDLINMVINLGDFPIMQSVQFRPSMTVMLGILATAGLVACSGGSTSSNSYAVPSEPTGLGYAETADVPSGVTAYVDTGATNTRGDSCHSTLDTNAGVRVLKGYLDFWTPLTQVVDAGITSFSGSCATYTTSLWSGIPGTSPDGTIVNSTVNTANITYSQTTTTNRTTAQALAAYLDDRRGKGYSVSDGMGPLTSTWRSGTQQTTSITDVDPTVTTSTVASDSGNNLGVGSSSNSTLGLAVDFIGNLDSGSTEPAKRFYKYARPFRWNTNYGYSVSVVPALVAAESSTPITDGGFPSGHTAEAWRDTLMMAYLVPQRYQELISRAMELGQNRIVAGMHSPLDVMGGRIQATAVVAYNLNSYSYYSSSVKQAAYNQAQSYLMAQTGASDFNALNTVAHTTTTTDTSSANYDRFSDYATNKANFITRLTYGFGIVNTSASGKTGTVPKGAEALLETRLPYLTAAQRRVVLKTTEIDSGYPLADDDEGWGRLNLFSAADGYGAFNGDVTVTMDSSLGGFNALDYWRNNISGAGLLTKAGTGTLHLTGTNTYTGGTDITAGTLAADSTSALGKGDVYLKAGTLLNEASGVLSISGNFTQVGGTLNLALTSSTKGTLTVSGITTLNGGALVVSFPGSYTPAVGDTITVLNAGTVNGKFSSITVNGFSKVTATYTSAGLQLYIAG
jgi:autotransporter-associated beta strand protein